MSPLSGVFLWLLPLAFLPVVIHMLNRLRYRTVKWAAMMFLRTADRDASRRAKIRQWIILAARCLMLAAFLLALARMQSRGRLARFFDQGSSMVVVIFDRSPGMEQQRGGMSARERSLALVQQGLSELGPNTRVHWLDSATGRSMTLPRGVELARLPQVAASGVPTDMGPLLREALREIARAGVSDAEIWIPGDRRSVTWLPPGGSRPDWSEWEGLADRVTLRLLDVGGVPADEGNRTLQLVGEPRREGDVLQVDLRLVRDREAPETVAVTVDAAGLVFQDPLMVEGFSYRWTQEIPIAAGERDVHAFITIPSDSNILDNEVAVSWRPRGALQTKVDVEDAFVARATRAALLPRSGQRELLPAMDPLSDDVAFWVWDGTRALRTSEQEWIAQGGVLLHLPRADAGRRSEAGEEGLGVVEWQEDAGVLGADVDREPLRLDLVRVQRLMDLTVAEEAEVLATLADGSPFLVREAVGEGAIYRLASLPLRDWSNLDAGFVWVPVIQRLLREGVRREVRWGTHRLGDWRPRSEDEWEPLDGEDRDPQLHVGRYASQGNVVALNRVPAHDGGDLLDLDELQTWAAPLSIQVFEDQSVVAGDEARRVEFTTFLALLGLLLLLVESFLLTLNIRRPVKSHSAWSAST